MQISSKRFLSRTGLRLMVAGGLLGLTVPAAAQVGGPPFLPPALEAGPGGMCVDREARLAAALAFLEVKIGLKAEQRSAWEEFAAAMRAAGQSLRDLCEKPPPPPRPGDPMAMLEARDRVMAAHTAMMQAVRAAVTRLKDGLAPEQQRRLAEALLLPRDGLEPGGGIFGHPGMGMGMGAPPGFGGHGPMSFR